MSERKGRWIQTWSGVAYYPADPRPEDVRVADIAHALAHLCRYNGHTDRFYSVAEHSVLVSHCVPAEHALVALLHDAEEAYISDVTRPVKAIFREAGVTLLDELAALNYAAVAQAFGLPAELPECVHVADNQVLLAEKEQIRGPSPQSWNGYNLEGLEPAKVTVVGFQPPYARDAFLARFTELWKAKHGL